MDDSKRQEGEGVKAKAPKAKAEDNPWYVLATLYGEREHANNWRAWNRFFARRLNEETRLRLIEMKRHPKEELEPFDDLTDLDNAFAIRCRSALPVGYGDIISIFSSAGAVSLTSLLLSRC